MGNLSPGGLKLFHALLQAPAAAEFLKPADSPQSASKLSRSKVMRLLRLFRFKAVTRLDNTRVFYWLQILSNSIYILSNEGKESLYFHYFIATAFIETVCHFSLL